MKQSTGFAGAENILRRGLQLNSIRIRKYKFLRFLHPDDLCAEREVSLRCLDDYVIQRLGACKYHALFVVDGDLYRHYVRMIGFREFA
jgi:hypothetical protein